MPRNTHAFPDGWYKNVSKDGQGNQAPLNVGWCVFAPGQTRFITAKERHLGLEPFQASLDNGRLLGPYETREMALYGAQPETFEQVADLISKELHEEQNQTSDEPTSDEPPVEEELPPVEEELPPVEEQPSEEEPVEQVEGEAPQEEEAPLEEQPADEPVLDETKPLEEEAIFDDNEEKPVVKPAAASKKNRKK